MILSFSVRDNHPLDKKIIAWYKGLTKSEKSREFREIILNYLKDQSFPIIKEEVPQPTPEPIQEPPKPKAIPLQMQPISISKKKDEEVDLDSQIDNLAL